MMKAEMDKHLGYVSYECSDNDNYRNGTKKKTIRSNYGAFQIDVPQDRQSSFEPKVVKKRQNKWKKYTALNAVKVSSPMS